jgi:cytochrome P450
MSRLPEANPQLAPRQNFVRFNPHSEEFRADPFAKYRELLEMGPVLRTRTGTCLVLGYDCAKEVLSSDCFTREASGRKAKLASQAVQSPSFRIGTEIMLNLDPPKHAQVRQPFIEGFLGRSLLKEREFIESEAKRLVDQIPSSGKIDLVTQFALPFTLGVVSRVLGLQHCPSQAILDFVETHMFLLELNAPRPSDLERAANAALRMEGFLNAELENPQPGTLMASVADAVARNELSRSSALANVALILPAGFETTINLLCSGLHLIRSSERQTNPGIKGTINEVLRLAPAIHMTTRTARSSVDLGGIAIEAGTPVIVIMAAANRDPDVFNRPDEFLPDRKGPASLSFGAGIHYCLGVNLARLEAEIGWAVLLERFKDVPPDRMCLAYKRQAAFRTPSEFLIEQN